MQQNYEINEINEIKEPKCHFLPYFKKIYTVLLVCEIKSSLLIQENTGPCHMSSMYTTRKTRLKYRTLKMKIKLFYSMEHIRKIFRTA